MAIALRYTYIAFWMISCATLAWVGAASSPQSAAPDDDAHKLSDPYHWLSEASDISFARDGRWRDSTLRTLSASWAAMGEFDRAKEIAARVRYHRGRDWTFKDIAVSQARAALLEEALNTVADIGQPGERHGALADVAKALADTDLHKQAIPIAQSVGDPAVRARALQGVAHRHARAGRLELATAAGADIKDPVREVQVWGVIASKHGAMNNAEEARRSIERAERAAEVLADDSYNQGLAYLFIVRTLAELQEFEWALRTAQNIDQDHSWHGWAHRDIALAQIQAADLADALDTAANITRAATRAEAYVAMASLLRTHETQDDAVALEERAVRMARGAADQIARDDAWARIAEVSADPANLVFAMNAFESADSGNLDLAMKAIVEVKEPWFRDPAIAAIALAQVREGLFDEAHQTITASSSSVWVSNVYKEIAIAHARSGRIVPALVAAEQLPVGLARASTYREIGAARIRGEDGGTVRDWINGIETPALRVFALIGVAEGLHNACQERQ